MKNYSVLVNGKNIQATLVKREGASLSFEVAGKRYDIEVSPIISPRSSGIAHVVAPVSTAATPSKKSESQGAIVAPMPGIIVQVPVKVGDQVSMGQTLVIMEAMKMENNVPATRPGIVKEVLVKAGDEVFNGQALVTLN